MHVRARRVKHRRYTRMNSGDKWKSRAEQSACIAPCMVYKPLWSAQAWITQFKLQGTPCLPLPRKRSPDGASTDWSGEHLIAAHYSFIEADPAMFRNILECYTSRTAPKTPLIAIYQTKFVSLTVLLWDAFLKLVHWFPLRIRAYMVKLRYFPLTKKSPLTVIMSRNSSQNMLTLRFISK